MTIKGFENEDNTFDFKECIIAHCRTLDKDDVYQWVADDEVKINNLLEENQQLKEHQKIINDLLKQRQELIEYLKEQINECKLSGNDENYVRADVYEEILNKIEKR